MQRFITPGTISGAFADGAVLFPLMAALVWQTGMNAGILLATAGAAYLAAGIVFRVPMSVQPLKSVVVAALAMNASALEIHVSALVVGLVCLGLSLCYADWLAEKVPRHIVQGLQLGLGILLMIKGVEWGAADGYADADTLIFLALVFCMLISSLFTSKPVLGWVATGGLAISLGIAVYAPEAQGSSTASPPAKSLRPDIILALVLPQLALTLTNSVVATHDVSRRYFGEQARRVRPKRLLCSIGFGNLASAGLGGLPFCHGSGGITAHYKGGARSWHMNLVIAFVLLVLALVPALSGLAVIPTYPAALMAALIFAVGFFHIQLAAPSWQHPHLRWILVVMGIVALISQNMLWILCAGVVCEMARRGRYYARDGARG